ncbi:MAG: UbiA family prenyltransferase [Candidatus Omnitrophica bacterium]|nr:UbiA family prenyltransferase [Candidatus Omnitrophota bacterium]
MIKKISAFLELIKFEHSIFALPFAYLGLFLAENGWPRFRIFWWVTVAMVAIRTSAMCLNRLIDQPIDEKNPRTQGRIQLIYLLTRPVIWLIMIASLLIAFFSAAQVNWLCLALLPIPIVLIWIYPYLKRITWFSHFILGMILGIAPIAGWLSSRAEWAWSVALLGLAVACWVSGFDMFYALQDVEFDRAHRLKSCPVQFGTAQTILTVRALHGITVLALLVFGLISSMGFWYWLGWVIVFGLIVREHQLVKQFGLSKINEAFFNMNAWVSVVIFLAVAIDLIA